MGEGSRVLYVSLQGVEEGQGAATHVRAVVEGLRRRHPVQLLAPSRVPQRGLRGAARRVGRTVGLQLRAARAVRDSDVAYVRHHPAVLPLAWWLQRHGVPQVHEVNGPVEDFALAHPALGPVVGLLRWMSVAGLRRADVVIAVSDQMAAHLRSQGIPADRLRVVHNGADLDRFGAGSVATAARTSPYVVFVGALTPWQGLDVLAAATREPTWPDGVRVVVAGDGPSRTQLDAARPGAVDALGTVPHDRVAGLLAGALAALSPKTPAARWSSPLKVYEAIAAGIPCIVTDVGEQADLVRSLGCGLVVPPGDPAALAGAVGHLLEDPAGRAAMGAAATHARPSISWDGRVQGIEAMLSELTDTEGTDRLAAAVPGGLR